MLSDAQRKQSQRERTAKHREKMKARSAEQVAAAEQRRRGEFDLWRVHERLVIPGEREAFVDAESVPDALTVAREFLLALGQPDAKPGETLLDVERRVITHPTSGWFAIGAPLLSRANLKFDTSTASTTDGYVFVFDKSWVALPGSDQLIDVATLPVIEIPAVPDVPALDTPVIVEVAPTIEDTVAPTIEEQLAMEHRRQKGFCPVAPREALLLKTQQDAMDEKSRKLSQANEARELANERRLGPVAYAYEQSKQS